MNIKIINFEAKSNCNQYIDLVTILLPKENDLKTKNLIGFIKLCEKILIFEMLIFYSIVIYVFWS